MKILLCLFITGFTLLTLAANAQNNDTNKSNRAYIPLITKGYYSIGNNAEKLKTNKLFEGIQTENSPSIQKGYYSIGTHNEKLNKQVAVKALKKGRTVITKGYYSIGNNAERLQ